MQWSDLYVAAADLKVARRLTAGGDLQSFTGQIALGPDADELPALLVRSGVWVSTTPMTETVKDVGADGLVRATVPREGLSIACFPIVIPASIAYGAADPADLLRRVLTSGVELQRL